MNDPHSLSSGINTGAAQVFKPYRSPFLGQEAKQNAQGQKNLQAAYKNIGDLDKIEIFYKHQKRFAEMQGGIKDYTLKNIAGLREGDPVITMGLQELVSNYKNQANVSKGIKQNYNRIASNVITNQDKYDDETFDYLDTFQGVNQETGELQDIDPTAITQRVDLGEDFKATVLPQVEKLKTTGGVQWQNPNGSIGGLTTTEFSDTDASKLAAQRLTDPHVFKQAQKDWKKEDPSGQNFADVTEWYKDKFITPYVGVEKKSTLTKDDSEVDGSGLTESDVVTNYEYNIVNPKDQSVEKTVSTKSLVLPTNAVANVPATAHTIDLKTGTSVLAEGGGALSAQLNTTGGTINITKTKEGKKEVYKPMLYTTASYKNADGATVSKDVAIPLADVQNKFVKHKKAIDVLFKEADRLNGGGKKTTAPAGAKKGDTKTLTSGKIAVYNGTKWVLK